MSATVTAVAEAGYWRVKIAWPNIGPQQIRPRLFGKFETKAEPEKWIEEHHWLTEQRQEPDVAHADDPEAPNER